MPKKKIERNFQENILEQISQKRKWLITGASVILILALGFLLAPKLFIAFVDHKPITFVEYYSILDSRYGKDTREQLISERLIFDEAKMRGVNVSDTEINDQIKKVEDQEQGAANLDSVLKQQGLTKEDLKKQIKLQTLIKKMFGQGVNVSDDDVNKYLEQNKQDYPEVTDEVRKNIKDQLIQQKIAGAFRSWLQQVQQSSRVVRL